MNATDILRKHFELQYDVKLGEDVPNDNVAHFWLINKDWPVIGNMIVLSEQEFDALSMTLEARYVGK